MMFDVNKRPKFANFNHLIMPVKNEFGNCRFYYRGFLKKSLMENILNRQKIMISKFFN